MSLCNLMAVDIIEDWTCKTREKGVVDRVKRMMSDSFCPGAGERPVGGRGVRKSFMEEVTFQQSFKTSSGIFVPFLPVESRLLSQSRHVTL